MGLLKSFTGFIEALRPSSVERLEVLEQDEFRCVIQGDHMPVVLDLDRRVVMAGTNAALPFARFDQVLIQRCRDEDEGPIWRVELTLKDRGCLEVGSSHDDVQASIAAAALSRHLGCPVRTA
jgi:hypothetical protein